MNNQRFTSYLQLLHDIIQRNDAPLQVDETTWEELLMIPMDQVIGTLLPQQQTALRFRYGLDTGHSMSYVAVGEQMHRSGGRIGQIVQKALKMIRYSTRGHYFWLLYGIDRRCSLQDYRTRPWGEYKEVPDITLDELRAAASEVMAYYKRFTPIPLEQAALDAYTAFHTGHDKYYEQRWKNQSRLHHKKK